MPFLFKLVMYVAVTGERKYLKVLQPELNGQSLISLGNAIRSILLWPLAKQSF